MTMATESCKTSFYKVDKPFDRDTIINELIVNGMVLPRSKHDCVTLILKMRLYPTFIEEQNQCQSAELYKTIFDISIN